MTDTSTSGPTDSQPSPVDEIAEALVEQTDEAYAQLDLMLTTTRQARDSVPDREAVREGDLEGVQEFVGYLTTLRGRLDTLEQVAVDIDQLLEARAEYVEEPLE